MTKKEAKDSLEYGYTIIIDDVSYFLNSYKFVVGGHVDYTSISDFFDYVDVSEAELDEDS